MPKPKPFCPGISFQGVKRSTGGSMKELYHLLIL